MTPNRTAIAKVALKSREDRLREEVRDEKVSTYDMESTGTPVSSRGPRTSLSKSITRDEIIMGNNVSLKRNKGTHSADNADGYTDDSFNSPADDVPMADDNSIHRSSEETTVNKEPTFIPPRYSNTEEERDVKTERGGRDPRRDASHIRKLRSGSRYPSSDEINYPFCRESERIVHLMKTEAATRRENSRKNQNVGISTLEVSATELSFLTTRHQCTLRRVENLSGAEISIREDPDYHSVTLETKGTISERNRAAKYIKCIMVPRNSKNTTKHFMDILGNEDHFKGNSSNRPTIASFEKNVNNHNMDDDCSIIYVPKRGVGYITGKQGTFLRAIEDEWETMIFFTGMEGFELNGRVKYPFMYDENIDVQRKSTSQKRDSQEKEETTEKSQRRPLFLRPRSTLDVDTSRGKQELETDDLLEPISYECDNEDSDELEEEKELRREAVVVDRKHIDDDISELPQGRSSSSKNVGISEEDRRTVETDFHTLDCAPFYQDSIFGIDVTNRLNLESPGSVSKELCDCIIIFGHTRGRIGTALKIMCSIEGFLPGFYKSQSIRNDIDDFDSHSESTKPFMVVKKMKVDNIPYLLGKRGVTKKKLMESSRALIEYIGHNIHIYGNRTQIENVNEYIVFLLQQLQGSIELDTDRADMSHVDVPGECVGYVTGRQREMLGKIEEEWGVLMFFTGKAFREATDIGQLKKKTERLVIVGPARSRRGALLRVMSSVETKCPGWFSDGCIDDKIDDYKGFATERMQLNQQDVSYALGKLGMTRKKLAAASGCIVDYIGYFAFFSGSISQRIACKEYLRWLLEQRSSEIFLTEASLSKRSDCVMRVVTKNTKDMLYSNRSEFLKRLEAEFSIFCFIAEILVQTGEEVDSTVSHIRKDLGGMHSSKAFTGDDCHYDTRLLMFSYSSESRFCAAESVDSFIHQTIVDCTHQKTYGKLDSGCLPGKGGFAPRANERRYSAERLGRLHDGSTNPDSNVHNPYTKVKPYEVRNGTMNTEYKRLRDVDHIKVSSNDRYSEANEYQPTTLYPSSHNRTPEIPQGTSNNHSFRLPDSKRLKNDTEAAPREPWYVRMSMKCGQREMHNENRSSPEYKPHNVQAPQGPPRYPKEECSKVYTTREKVDYSLAAKSDNPMRNNIPSSAHQQRDSSSGNLPIGRNGRDQHSGDMVDEFTVRGGNSRYREVSTSRQFARPTPSSEFHRSEEKGNCYTNETTSEYRVRSQRDEDTQNKFSRNRSQELFVDQRGTRKGERPIEYTAHNSLREIPYHRSPPIQPNKPKVENNDGYRVRQTCDRSRSPRDTGRISEPDAYWEQPRMADTIQSKRSDRLETYVNRSDRQSSRGRRIPEPPLRVDYQENNYVVDERLHSERHTRVRDTLSRDDNRSRESHIHSSSRNDERVQRSIISQANDMRGINREYRSVERSISPRRRRVVSNSRNNGEFEDRRCLPPRHESHHHLEREHSYSDRYDSKPQLVDANGRKTVYPRNEDEPRSSFIKYDKQVSNVPLPKRHSVYYETNDSPTRNSPRNNHPRVVSAYKQESSAHRGHRGSSYEQLSPRREYEKSFNSQDTAKGRSYTHQENDHYGDGNIADSNYRGSRVECNEIPRSRVDRVRRDV